MQRKLTVILAADVVGYSALMERDEAGTLARLQENRKAIFDPRIAAHGGRVFKLMGDGALAEFPSAVAAVSCALEIQDATEAAQAGTPEPEKLRYRIGINLGDIIVEGDDIYGEGVNVAARLQTLAPVGGVAVSRNVSEQVSGKIAASFEDLGAHGVKNIERPVHVFAVRAGGAPTNTMRAPVPDRAQSVAICVLPFANMSGDAEQEYFSDGISEDIITDLSKVSALWVAARNTSFTFKGKSVDVPQVARQLKVSHVLEGSVRKSGGRVRITAQLIDATGGHVWAERWDRDLNDIFALQDEISEAIVKALKCRLLPEEKQAIERRDTQNPEAYELFLLAKQFDRTGSERMKPIIVRLCDRITELDPNFARAHALKSMAIAEMTQRGVAGWDIGVAIAAAERAVVLAPHLAEAHAALAECLARGPDLDFAAGKDSIETALKLDPRCYEAHLSAGYMAIAKKAYPDAIAHFEAACEVEPNAYRPAGMVVQAYEALGDKDGLRMAAQRSKERCERLLLVEPDHGGALGFFVNALVDLGEHERAREWVKRAMLFDPENVRLQYNLACGMAAVDADLACTLLEGILPRVSPGWRKWIGLDNSLDPIRAFPRFIALCAAYPDQA
ncbi:MAG: adenylate/guanylate cyclase domain-containing protein [Terricaulis sp.]